MDRLGNLLHATATAISDAQAAAMGRQGAMKPSAVAAILTLGQHDKMTLSQLAGTIGISHSATVRLVDGLAGKRLVLRAEGRDRREVALSLTTQGRALYAKLRHEQQVLIAPILAALTPAEHAVLEAALARVLTVLTLGRESADYICRFCDEGVCGQDNCPVELRAMELDGA